MNLKSPKKYPVYFSLLDAGIRPRIARRMIARMLERDPSVWSHEAHPGCFCNWASDESYYHHWARASHHFHCQQLIKGIY